MSIRDRFNDYEVTVSAALNPLHWRVGGTRWGFPAGSWSGFSIYVGPVTVLVLW